MQFPRHPERWPGAKDIRVDATGLILSNIRVLEPAPQVWLWPHQAAFFLIINLASWNSFTQRGVAMLARSFWNLGRYISFINNWFVGYFLFWIGFNLCISGGSIILPRSLNFDSYHHIAVLVTSYLPIRVGWFLLSFCVGIHSMYVCNCIYI